MVWVLQWECLPWIAINLFVSSDWRKFENALPIIGLLLESGSRL